MKWQSTDLAKYFKAKEYVDTAIIPLVPISVTNESDCLKFANYQQTLEIITREVERNFTGRILLSPIYTYVQQESYQIELARINQWVDKLFKQDFKYVFFLTYDVKWKKEEQGLDGTLLWLPGSKITDYQSEMAKKLIQEQTSQIGELIRSFW